MTLFGDYMKICIIGNGKRHEILERNLSRLGYETQHITSASDIKESISAEYIVLPIPTLTKDSKVNLPGYPNDKSIEDLFSTSNFKKAITCNYISNNYDTVDINQRDDFAYLNAVPTAEGAIHAAVENCEYSLFYGKILITGFGRVAKILSDRLKGLKCNVTIAARSLKDLSYAKALGFNTININKLSECIHSYDTIFQTVPVMVLDRNILNLVNPQTVIIELSSKSAGTDYDYAEKLGVKIVHAPALPERVAPVTAGNILTECVLSIITEDNNPRLNGRKK